MGKRGGARPNSGRKPKEEEQKLIERLDSLIDPMKAIQVLANKIQNEEDKALELYFKYRFGLPKQSVDVTSDNQPFILTLNGTKSKTD